MRSNARVKNTNRTSSAFVALVIILVRCVYRVKLAQFCCCCCCFLCWCNLRSNKTCSSYECERQTRDDVRSWWNYALYREEKTLNNINFNRKSEKETIEYLNFSWNYCKNSKMMMMKATVWIEYSSRRQCWTRFDEIGLHERCQIGTVPIIDVLNTSSNL